MKSLGLKVTVFLLIAAMAFACEGNKYKLEFNLSDGESYNLNIISEVNTVQGEGEREMKLNTTSIINTSYNVIERNTMQAKYNLLKIIIDRGVQKIMLESDTPEDIATPENMGVMLKAMIGIPVEMKISKTGGVDFLGDYEEMYRAIVSTIGDSTNWQVKSQMVNGLKAYINDQTMTSSFEQISVFYPKKAVAVGESWNISMQTNSGQTDVDVVGDVKISLKSVDENIATLEIDGIVATDEKGAVIQIEGIECVVNLAGTLKGTIQINLNTGWPVNAEITQSLSGNMELMGRLAPQTIIKKITVHT